MTQSGEEGHILPLRRDSLIRGIACTTDSCNEGADACDPIPDAPGCLTPNLWDVDANAVGAGDGTSWADAFNMLQDALAAAVYGDDIWVAAGIYEPDEGAGQTTGDMAATFWLRNGVAMYDRFLGTESTVAERNLTDLADPLRQTVLGGGFGIPGDPTDNTTHVVTVAGVDDPTVLDGFTIRNGNALDVLDGGGGMLFRGFATLANCTFSQNYSTYEAGGFATFGASSSLTNCILWGNTGGGTQERQQLFGAGPLLSVDYSCVQGWTGGLGSVGNIGSDPMFADPRGPDGVAGTDYGVFRFCLSMSGPGAPPPRRPRGRASTSSMATRHRHRPRRLRRPSAGPDRRAVASTFSFSPFRLPRYTGVSDRPSYEARISSVSGGRHVCHPANPR